MKLPFMERGRKARRRRDHQDPGKVQASSDQRRPSVMLAADPPAVIVTAPVDKPAEVVVVSRDAHSDVLASADTPLPLIKAGKTEEALLRQVIFLTITLTVVRPAAGTGEDLR